MWRKGTLLHCWWECKLVQSLWRTVCRFLKKLKIELLCDPAIPCTPMFIAALFTFAKIWKPPKCLSAQEWIKKMWYTYTKEYYSAIKKNEIPNLFLPSSLSPSIITSLISICVCLFLFCINIHLYYFLDSTYK